MEVLPFAVGPRPPLRTAWRATVSLTTALLSGESMYGISSDGKATAINADTGAVRWQTSALYQPDRLAVSDNALYAFQPGAGFMKVTDQGTTFAEQALLEMTPQDQPPYLSNPVVQGTLVHFVKDNSLMAINTSAGGVAYQLDLNAEGPHSLYALDTDLLVVSGAGRPTRLRPGNAGYTLVWSTGHSGSADLTERACLVTSDRVVVAEPGGVAVYNRTNGSRVWSRQGNNNKAFAVQGDALYCAGDQAALWALGLADGSVRWDRKYLAFVSSTARVGLAAGEAHLWVGAMLDDGAEPAALWTVNLSDGSFAWQATGVALVYGNGLPLMTDTRVYTYGSSDPVTAMEGLASLPAVSVDQIKQTPNPLRGPMVDFNPLEVNIQLTVPANVSFIAWHERDQRNNGIGPIPYQPGSHFIRWDGRWPRGWTDINQFGRLAFDIEETATGLRYTQVLLVPVNTLPDIHHHWSKNYVETMLYHKFIGGYPDLTFRPDNLVTRAESAIIIAKTLGLEQPSSGWRTKFTDIATHWARNYIMALEERGVVGGFLEPDGTYTFRPDLNMNRSQEARILVRAYSVAKAPDGFTTRFRDIAGHWAEDDIKALEYKGYVNGFREPDGSYTYRPEQSLTRAELCTVVVRIRNLTR